MKWTVTCILCTHQKSYKLDAGIMLIFVSEKNRPLLLAKGVCVAISICACLVSSLIFCNKWGSVCSTVQLKFRWQRCHVCTLFYYHHQIGSIDFRLCCHIILWICVWGGYNTTICRSRCIYTWKVGTLYYLGKLSSILSPYGRIFYEI